MPIEFRCAECGRLLRVPDGTTGRPSKCPTCGHVQPIPAPAGPGTDPTALPLPPAGTPLPGSRPPLPPSDAAAWQPPEPSTDADPANPFAAPRFTGSASLLNGDDAADRDGPAWERDGAGVGSFAATVLDCLFRPSQGFGRMRLDGGGIFLPLAFAVIAMAVGVLVNMAVLGAFAVFGVLADGADAPDAGVMLVSMAFVGGFYLVAGAAAIGVMTFVVAAINKLLLGVLGAPEASFESVYRVTAYALGTGAATLALPCLGPLAMIVAQAVVLVLGISHGLGVGGGKAALIGLMPFLFCCLGPMGLGVVVAMVSG